MNKVEILNRIKALEIDYNGFKLKQHYDDELDVIYYKHDNKFVYATPFFNNSENIPYMSTKYGKIIECDTHIIKYPNDIEIEYETIIIGLFMLME